MWVGKEPCLFTGPGRLFLDPSSDHEWENLTCIVLYAFNTQHKSQKACLLFP